MKTTILFVAAVLVGGFFLFGDSFGSMVETTVYKSREKAEGSLGLDFKISRLENALSKADGELRDSGIRVAKIQVKKENLTEERETLKKREAKCIQDIHTLTEMYELTDLGEHDAVFRGKTIKGPEVEKGLQLAQDRLIQLRRTLASRAGLIDQYGNTLNSSRDQVAEMKFTKEQLALRAETMRFELEGVELEEALRGLAVGGSSLSEAQQLSTEIDDALRTRQIILIDQTDPLKDILGDGDLVGEALLESGRLLTTSS